MLPDALIEPKAYETLDKWLEVDKRSRREPPQVI
jgi:hypothetical protein